jgi:hypothetical protein
MAREPFEYPPRRRPIARSHGYERVGDRGFHGTAAGGIHTRTARRQSKDCSPTIPRIVDAQQPSLCHQPLQHARQGAWMHVEDRRQVTRRDPWEEPHDTERQPLWSGDPKVAGHTL